MTMKFDTPGQAARLNAEFDTLTEDQQKTVLHAVNRARSSPYVHSEEMPNGRYILAKNQIGEGEIIWVIKDENGNIKKGVFPE